MLSREEAKALYDATRQWDYWTESLIPDIWGGSQKDDWKEAIRGMESAAKYLGKDIEDVSVDTIMKLNELGVKSKRSLARAILDYAFMTNFILNMSGEIDDSYKEFMTDGVLTEEGLGELGEHYGLDSEGGFVPVLSAERQ